MNTEKMLLENKNEPSCLGDVNGSGFSVGDITQFGRITHLSEYTGMAEIKSKEKELYFDYSSKKYRFRTPTYHVKIWRLRLADNVVHIG